MITTILFFIVLSVLVFVHELGHFLAAKMFKIRVDEFALGFPPKVFSFKKGETTYAFNLLPLGGYVKIHGENPENSLDASDKRSFQNVAWWKQVVVLAAGVTFNIVFAWLLLSASLMIGTSKASVEGIPPAYVYGETKVLVQQVSENSPASNAGIKAGDIITAVGSSTATSTVGVQHAIKSSTSTTGVVITIERATSTTALTVIPDKENKVIGVALAEVALIKMPLFPALKHGFIGTYSLIEQLGAGVIGFFKKLFVGDASMDEVSGPVGIAKIVGMAGREGLAALLFISTLISISLAIMNILPFPALDGGRIVIALIEGVIRRRLNTKFVNTLNTIGFMLLLLLMLVVTIKDIL